MTIVADDMAGKQVVGLTADATHEHDWDRRTTPVNNALRAPSIVVFYVCTGCGAWRY